MADGKLILHHSNYVANAFRACLRTAFADPGTPAIYRYSEQKAGRQIGIYRVYPKREIMYPHIFVETGVGDVSIDKLGLEVGYPIFDPPDSNNVVAWKFTGDMFIPVKLTIKAKTLTDMQQITDLVAIYIRYAFRQVLAMSDIAYLGISAGSTDVEEGAGDNHIYTGEVEVKCQTHYEQNVDVSIFDAVNALNLQGVTAGTSDNDQTSNEPNPS
jgi:hypothetical protein